MDPLDIAVRPPVASRAPGPLGPWRQVPASGTLRPQAAATGVSVSVASLMLAQHTRRRAERRKRRQLKMELAAVAKVATARQTPAPHDLLLKVAGGEVGEHTPVWLMRQAGRYMRAFRAYSERYPFRLGAASCLRLDSGKLKTAP